MNTSLHSHLDHIEAVDKQHKKAIENARQTMRKLDDPDIELVKIDGRTWKYWHTIEKRFV